MNINNRLKVSVLFITLLLVSCSAQQKQSNNKTGDKTITVLTETKKSISEEASLINESATIRDMAGNKVDVAESMRLLESGEWTVDPVNGSNGKLLYLQLRKMSEEEKKVYKQIIKQTNNSVLIGKKASEFHLTDLNGNSISSENTKGKVVVLNFWFTTCKPCIAEIPKLNRVYEAYQNNPNVVFASITFDKRDRVEKFLTKQNIKYPVVTDEQNTCDLFQVMAFPSNIVIDKNGNYYYFVNGGFGQISEMLISSIQNALENKSPKLNMEPPSEMTINSNSTFKLENGQIISVEKVMEIMNTNNYDIIEKKDKKGKEFYLLKKIN